MATTIAIMNQKGGVAKTTTSINLAAQAALKGRTLIVDTDEQANLSKQFGVRDPGTTIRDALLGNDFTAVNVRKNLDIIPSSEELIGIESQLFNMLSREAKLKNALKRIANDYDYVFIDCPSNTSLVTINALVATDYVILPIKAEIFSIEGIEHMINYITSIKEGVNEDLAILGILITQYEERLTLGKRVMDKMKEYEWDQGLFKTMIRKNIKLAEAQEAEQTIFEYDRKSSGAQDYASLGQEVLGRIKKLKKQDNGQR